MIQSSLKCLPTSRCGVPKDEGCTQPFSSDPMINLRPQLFLINFPSQGSPQIRVSCSRTQVYRSNNSKEHQEGGVEHTRAQEQHHCRRGNSPVGWRNAPALNPKMRRGLSVLPIRWKWEEHKNTQGFRVVQAAEA
jgi:hypothetical protein